VGKGRGVSGRELWGEGERKGLMAFFSEVVKNCLEDFAVGDGVLVI
jgi:hypothetical protein